MIGRTGISKNFQSRRRTCRIGIIGSVLPSGHTWVRGRRKRRQTRRLRIHVRGRALIVLFRAETKEFCSPGQYHVFFAGIRNQIIVCTRTRIKSKSVIGRKWEVREALRSIQLVPLMLLLLPVQCVQVVTWWKKDLVFKQTNQQSTESHDVGVSWTLHELAKIHALLSILSLDTPPLIPSPLISCSFLIH